MSPKKIPQKALNATPENSPQSAAKKPGRKARAGKAGPQKTTSTNSTENVEAAPASEPSVTGLGVQSGCIIDEKKSTESPAENLREPVEGVSGESGPGDGPSPGAHMSARCWYCGHPAPAPKGLSLPVCPLHAGLSRRGRQVSFDRKRWSSNLHALEQGRGKPGPWD